MFEISFVHLLVVLSVLIGALGTYAYIRDTLAGKTKPNRVTWAMWAIAPLIGTGAAISLHSDPWATVRIFIGGFFPLLILIASYFNRESYWKLTPFDFGCAAFSLVALVAWLLADSPRAAILFAVIGDAVASLPTILKAWRFPETETSSTYLSAFLTASMAVPSITEWNIENSAFQIYLVSVNLILLLVVNRKRFRGGRRTIV